MRPPIDTIPAPPFPRGVTWLNTAPLSMDRLLGHPVLVEFFDFCRPNSLRTLPYIKEWHRRYAEHGLEVIGVHTPGFPPAADEAAVGDAVKRLGIAHPVVVDTDFEVWDAYGNEGWPARYLWDRDGTLDEFHYGEGAYEETERAIQGLLGVERAPFPALRPEDEPGALLAPQTADRPGAYSGPYEAGAVWAVLDGRGTLFVNGRELPVDGPSCVELIDHGRNVADTLELRVGPGVTCHAVCFTPGVAS